MHWSVSGATHRVRDSSKATLKKNPLMSNPTHRYVERPQLGLRYLADYMAGSKRKERSILQQSKYRPIAKIIQHDEAKSTVSKFILMGASADEYWLIDQAHRLRERLADDEFDRHLYDSNADYIARYAMVAADVNWPKAEILPPGKPGRIDVHGVRVTVPLNIRLRRTTRTNKIREGAAMLRYAKGAALPAEVGAWQSAFIWGYLSDTSTDQTVSPEPKLCLTVDAWAGLCHAAPSNCVSRYQNMKAACASIAEQWPNIRPPDGAVLE